MSEFSLTVDGRIHRGWQSIQLTRSMQTIAGSFTFEVSERWPGQQTARAILPGEVCAIAIDGETVLTGRVDEVTANYDSNSHRVAIAGRDATGRLVDCAAIHTPGEWNKRGIEDVVRALCEPFNIPVRLNTDAGAVFKKFKIEEGETAFEAIERACRFRAILPTSDGLGGLVLTRAAPDRAQRALKHGDFVRASGRFSHRERFSRYVVKAQQTSGGFTTASDSAQVLGEASDPGVGYYRPHVIVAEGALDAAAAAKRAQWEATTRAARARTITVVVNGWRQIPGGRLWGPNILVSLVDDWLGVPAPTDFRLVSVEFSFGSGGEISTLTLMPPGAFELIAVPEKADGGWLG